jgi:2-aminobenzoylacetyl-CoA thioesterase
MILSETGQIAKDVYVLGHPAAPAYLVAGRRPVIIDAGFTGLGRLYAEHAARILKGGQPADCFLTHSHFDHCGAVPVLKRHFPPMRVKASERARRVLQRPKAIALIRQLNQSALPVIAQMGISFDPAARFEAFAVDQTLAEGAVVRLSDELSIRVMETPGHTRDCLSFYIPERKILFSSEAAGQPDQTGYVISDCLSDFAAYRQSLHRLAQLEIEMLCLGHLFVYTGSDVRDYFRKAAAACDNFLRLVKICLEEEDGSMDATMARIKAIEYDSNPGLKQPEPAYLLNLEARLQAAQRFLEAGEPVSSRWNSGMME